MTAPAGDWPACYNEFFSRLKGVVGQGGKWKAVCPAHADVVQSLSVRVGAKNHLWVRCQAASQCSADRVVAAIGLRMDDLFPNNVRHASGGKSMSRQIECVYQYRDADGKILFETVRFTPKGFMQRRPNPAFDPSVPPDKADNPEYLYKMDDVKRVPYRLPDMVAALKKTPQKTVLILEGEKDCDLAWSVGMIATCNPMGAGKWPADFAAYFKGVNVAVIPDEDPVEPNLKYSPGVRHAEQVCDSLKGVARVVRLIRLPGVPEKGDFFDWWHKVATGTPDEKKKAFAKLATETPMWGTNATATPVVIPAGTTPSLPMEPPAQPPPDKATPGDPLTDTHAVLAIAMRKGYDWPNLMRQIEDKFGGKYPPARTSWIDVPQDVREKVLDALGKMADAPGKTEPKSEAKPDPKPKAAPPAPPADVPLTPPPGPKTEPPKPAPAVPSDRAARVAAWFKDVRESAGALKLAGVQVRSPHELYGCVRMAIAEFDNAMTLEGGVPRLDMARIGQVSLLLGAYFATAAAEFGLGVGLVAHPEQPTPAPTAGV